MVRSSITLSEVEVLMDIEAALLSKLLSEGCVGEFLEFAPKLDWFVSYRDVWECIKSTHMDTGEPPPVEYIYSRFPDFEIKPIKGSVSFFVEELKKRRVHSLMTESLKDVAKHLKDKDPNSAVEAVRRILQRVDSDTRVSRDINITADPESRIEAYDIVARSGGVTGYTTPWPCLDDVTLGFQSEDLVMIAGRGGTGKTWVETVLAWYHWTQGHLPILFSREMAAKQIVRRVDAIHAKLPFKRFRAGQLQSSEYARWKQALHDMKDGVPFWVCGDSGPSGISGIQAKIEKYKPSAVFIDGAYLIEDDRGGKNWEKFTNVCGDLKMKIAQKYQLPTIVTHQFNLAGKEDKGTADTLKYGDVQMWFDLIIGIYQPEELRIAKEMLFKIVKHREGEQLQWVSSWDLDNMDFQVKSSGVDDLGGTGSSTSDSYEVRY
jgi:hypothetical protein